MHDVFVLQTLRGRTDFSTWWRNFCEMQKYLKSKSFVQWVKQTFSFFNKIEKNSLRFDEKSTVKVNKEQQKLEKVADQIKKDVKKV